MDDEEINEHVKEVYKMRTIPLEEYRKKIRLQGAREEGIEEGIVKVARSMLGRGMPLPEVAEITELTINELQQLQPQ